MNDLINLIVNNGLGVASFIALIYFMKVSISKTNDTLKEINNTLVTIQTSLINLSERVSDLEEMKEKKKEK